MYVIPSRVHSFVDAIQLIELSCEALLLYVFKFFFCFLFVRQEMASSPVMSFDPLPPLDSTYSYTRPERYSSLTSKEETVP